MLKKMFVIGGMMATFASCKEVPIAIDKGDRVIVDTTYVINDIPQAQAKKYLIEELSGVQCANCPAGMDKLTNINKEGAFKDKLVIASIHVGTFAWFLEGKSTQDLVVSGSEQLLDLVLGGDPGKPCSAFDRLDFKKDKKFLMINPGLWPNYMTNANDTANTTPVNIDVKSTFNEAENAYAINVKVTYTAAVDGSQSLNVYLVEDDIIDAMVYSASNIDLNYNFKHVLRAYITPPTGKVILNELATKEKGRVYEYNTSFKIDENNKQQAMWKADNMKIIAFVNQNEQYSKRVFQVQEVNLKP